MNLPIGYGVMDALSKAEQVLAVVGGAALGAVVAGLLAQLLTRWLARRKLPHFATILARFVGGAALGGLTALWMWQGTGSGKPGDTGSQNGNQVANNKPDADKDNSKVDPTAPKPPDTPPADDAAIPPESVLEIRVLSDEAMGDLGVPKPASDLGVPKPASDDVPYYQLTGDKEVKTPLTLKDVEKEIRNRLMATPPLRRLKVTLSPSLAADIGRVYNVMKLGKDYGLNVPPPTVGG